jgi:hypothetical protein
MNKLLQICLFVIFLGLFIQFSASAQNCTINAGADRTICPGQPFILQGSYSGSVPATGGNAPVWTQVSGPAVTLAATTNSGGASTAVVTGYSKGVNYTFRLLAKCTDGTPIADDAIYSSSTLTVAKAAATDTIYACPGTLTMAANAVAAGETGTWSVISGNLPLPNPASTSIGPTANTGTVSLPTTGNTVGATRYRWTITGSSGTCSTTADVVVVNLGGVTPVTAGPTFNVGCYTITASQQLNGSFGGDPNQPRQRGTWSFISGPSTPVFSNIHVNNATISNLVGGTYKIRWTVAGQCVNGSADVIINVDSPSQNVTGVGNANLVYCDGRTSTVLIGVNPLYANETVQWTASAGNPTTTTFSAATSPVTTVTGLNGTGNYNFTYKITNSVTGCSSSGTYTVSYTAPPAVNISVASPQILACGASTIDIPYTVSGGNGTQWALVSGPAGSVIESVSGYNNYTTAASNTQTIVGLTSIGTYVIRFRRFNNNASGGCSDAYADISVVVSHAPYQAVAGTSQFLPCATSSATLAGNAAQTGDFGTGTWSQVSGPNTAIIADKHLNTTGISGLVTGVYTFRWIVSGGVAQCGDTQSDTQVIVAAPPTIVNAGTDIASCFGTPVKLNGNVPQPGETGTWSFISESPTTPVSTIVFSNIHDPAAVVNGLLDNKTYALRWTINNSCGTITDNVLITTGAVNGPKQATAGTDQCLASGTTAFTLAGNAPSGGETGTWTLLPGAPNIPTFNANLNNATITGAANGTYTFEWRLDRGTCGSTLDTVVITVSPTTTAASITGAPVQNICGLTGLTLTANTPAATEVGTWTQTGGPGGAVINSPHSPTTTVSGLTADRYIFTWTITNNACSSSNASITYNLSEPPTVANAGINQTICNATSTTLAANTITSGTGLWSMVSGPNTPTFSNVSSPVSTVNGLILGVYTLKWTATGGPYCAPSESTMTITVGQSANAGPDQTLCNQTATVLSGNEGSTGTWSSLAGPTTPTITGNSNNTAVVTGMSAGTYIFRYTITSGGCGTLTDDMSVTVSPPPSAAKISTGFGTQELCTSAGTSIAFQADVPTGGSTGVWSIINAPAGSTATLSSTTNPSITLNNINKSGTYLLQWTVTSTNCTGTQSSNDIARLTVYDPPTTALPMTNQPAACTSQIQLTGTTPIIGVGTWTFISGPTTPTIDAPNSATTTISGITTASATPYIFRWTIANGTCTPSSQDVSVTVADVTPTTASVTTPVQAVCTTAGVASLTLTGNTPVAGTGTWTVVSQPAGSGTVTFTGADLHSPTATAGNLKAGIYVLNWTIANNATACSTVAIDTIHVYDPPSAAIAGSNNSFCLFSPVTLAATAPTVGIGTWSVVTNPNPDAVVFSDVNAVNPTVTGLKLGTYTFRWTTSNGPCAISTSDVNITITDCQIAVSKEAATPVPQPDKSFNVTFKFHIKNTGGIAVSNIQAQDDLTITFPSPKTFSIVSIANPGSGLVVNPGFNGNSSMNLLTAASSSLAAGAEEIVTVVVNVKLN